MNATRKLPNWQTTDFDNDLDGFDFSDGGIPTFSAKGTAKVEIVSPDDSSSDTSSDTVKSDASRKDEPESKDAGAEKVMEQSALPQEPEEVPDGVEGQGIEPASKDSEAQKQGEVSKDKDELDDEAKAEALAKLLNISPLEAKALLDAQKDGVLASIRLGQSATAEVVPLTEPQGGERNASQAAGGATSWPSQKGWGHHGRWVQGASPLGAAFVGKQAMPAAQEVPSQQNSVEQGERVSASVGNNKPFAFRKEGEAEPAVPMQPAVQQAPQAPMAVAGAVPAGSANGVQGLVDSTTSLVGGAASVAGSVFNGTASVADSALKSTASVAGSVFKSGAIVGEAALDSASQLGGAMMNMGRSAVASFRRKESAQPAPLAETAATNPSATGLGSPQEVHGAGLSDQPGNLAPDMTQSGPVAPSTASDAAPILGAATGSAVDGIATTHTDSASAEGTSTVPPDVLSYYDYRFNQAQDAVAVYEQEMQAMWQADRMAKVREMIDERAQELGVSVNEVVEKMRPGGELEDLHEEFMKNLDASPDARAHLAKMDEALDRYLKHNEHARQHIAKERHAPDPDAETLDKKDQDLDALQGRMEANTQQIPRSGNDQQSHLERLREAIRAMFERLKNFVTGLLRRDREHQSSPEPG